MGYDNKEKIIKHFRVDKMLHIKLENQKREGRRNYNQFDIASYTRKMFGMFDGAERWVRLQFENELAGIAIDRFGKGLKLYPGTDEKHFQINVKVAVSRQFFGWVFSIGSGVQIVAPEEIVDMMKKELQEVAKRY